VDGVIRLPVPERGGKKTVIDRGSGMFVLCVPCLTKVGGEGSISDIKIEMILSEGWKGGCTCGLPEEFGLKCIS